MTAQHDLNAMLRTVVAPALRRRGFKGSRTTWTIAAANNDTALVNVQSSQYSSAAEVRCTVNLAVIPSAWRDWKQSQLPNINLSAPKERHGLWRDRLRATADQADAHGWWSVSDARTAELAGRDMVQQLETTGLATLERLLNRHELITSIRNQDLGFAKGDANDGLFRMALAVLLADDGPSAELTDLLHQLDTNPAGGGAAATQALTAWVRARAAAPQETP